ncbi:MAG: squalene/phytoene synthase family protein [Geovibrio sp.]|nr:squalene/phytoene synthase family protein [Geovibrio sp.]
MSSLFDISSQLKRERYDYFLYIMLAPKDMRLPIAALLAFEHELQLIPHKVSEPMLGAIRFTWWQEALDLLESNTYNRKHPVIDIMNEAYLSSPEILPLLKQRLKLHHTHFEMEHEAHACEALDTSFISSITQYIQLRDEKLAARWQAKATLVSESNTVSQTNLKLLLKLFIL